MTPLNKDVMGIIEEFASIKIECKKYKSLKNAKKNKITKIKYKCTDCGRLCNYNQYNRAYFWCKNCWDVDLFGKIRHTKKYGYLDTRIDSNTIIKHNTFYYYLQGILCCFLCQSCFKFRNKNGSITTNCHKCNNDICENCVNNVGIGFFQFKLCDKCLNKPFD